VQGGARDGALTGRRRKKANRTRRTCRSLSGICLFDLDFLQLLLQPSRVDDRHLGLRGGAGADAGCGVVRGERSGLKSKFDLGRRCCGLCAWATGKGAPLVLGAKGTYDDSEAEDRRPVKYAERKTGYLIPHNHESCSCLASTNTRLLYIDAKDREIRKFTPD